MSELFYSLAVLACPVAMGLMMWFMARGMNRQPPAAPAGDVERRGGACLHRPAAAPPHDAIGRELELARTELELLRLRQRQREQSQAAG